MSDEAEELLSFAAPEDPVVVIGKLRQELREISRVKDTDYQVIAHEGEAYVVLLVEQASYDEPPGDQLMGSVGDLIRRLDHVQERINDVDLIRLAIADPGQFLPRGEDYTEPITSWSARAVVAALTREESQ